MVQLSFSYGTMGAGKSVMALSLQHILTANHTAVELWTFGDRSGEGVVTSRAGMFSKAHLRVLDEPLDGFLLDLYAAHVRVLIVDEAQFASPAQIDSLAFAVDSYKIDVYCFGLATTFQSELFPGAKRLFEIADKCQTLPLEVPCWCGAPGRINARLVNGQVVNNGPEVALGDIAASQDLISYKVLCRSHWLDKQPELPALEDSSA